MPQEIADSDAESDLGSPPRPSASPISVANIIEAQPSTLEQDPWANLEFDQFLSPTQRLSSALERQDAFQSRSLSSTDKFLQEIAQADEELFNSFEHRQGLDGSMDNRTRTTPRSKKKRTITEIEYGSSGSKHDEQSQQRSLKRAKTYGNSRSQKSDDDFLFSGTSDRGSQQVQSPDKQYNGHRQNESTSTELPVQRLVNPDSIETSKSSGLLSMSRHAQAYHQPGSTSFHSGNIHNTSVTKSFTGGYQGINLDYRGAGLGLEAGTNPFGSLSQVSLDGDVNQTQTERFASLFRHSQQSLDDNTANHDPVTVLQKSHFNEMATSPLRISNTDARALGSNGSAVSRNDTDLTSETVPTVLPNHAEAGPHGQGNESAEMRQKKRGRKPKDSHSEAKLVAPNVDTFQQLQQEDPLDLPAEQYKPRPSRSRAGTVESVASRLSQASQESQEIGNATPKKKRPTDSGHTTSVGHKSLSSELNLSDPAMIGAPKEMYVPRPSKSRSKRIINDDDEDELQRAESPVRMRSPSQAVEVLPSTSTKKKPGRKSKVKRAKTSAAALAKSAEMYDEDDKDCILVDEAPVKVKMAPLPEISPIKQEGVELGLDTEQDKHLDGPTTKRIEKLPEPQAEVKISVDIPKLPITGALESTAPKPEPKKRGRKPKKKPEEQTQPVTEIEAEADEQTTHHKETTAPSLSLSEPRAILSEKDLNIPSPISPDPQQLLPPPTPSPPAQKPVHSPLKPKLTTATTTSKTPDPSTRASTPTSTSSASNLWSRPRIGLSRRTTIPSLLRKLDRSKEPPRVIERKEKLSKRQQEEQDRRKLEAEDAGEAYVDRWEVRGKDGMLVEWDE